MIVSPPKQLDMHIRSSAKHGARLHAFVDETGAAADVSGTVAWVFRRSARSTVVMLDASARVSVYESGTLQVGPLTVADTEALVAGDVLEGTYILTLDDLPLIEGRWTATPSEARSTDTETTPTNAVLSASGAYVLAESGAYIIHGG